MKKICAVLLLFATLLTMAPLVKTEVKADTPTERVIFVDAKGTGDGSSPDKPLNSLTSAFYQLAETGGRIVLVGSVIMQGSGFVGPAHTKKITVTQNYGDIDYRSKGSLDTGGSSKRFIINGPVAFENLRITTSNKAAFLLIAHNNPITIDEGVTCEGFDYNVIGTAATILGGLQGGVTPRRDAGLNSNIVIKSGKFTVVGINRNVESDTNGTAKIEIYGGEVHKLYGGSVNGGTGKSTDITIHGGKISATVAAEYGVSESVKLTVNGGDFTGCPAITGSCKSSEATLSDKIKDDVMHLLSGFKQIKTSQGVITQKVAEDVFGSGSFTGSNGATIPYRIYFPEGYDKNAQKTYPVFFYFHGNGARGTDNTQQLGKNHAIVTRVLNSGTDCIIVAPQCPASSAWILNANYPGGLGFDPEKKPESPYFCAALELYGKIVKEEKVDISRIYIGGGSNGAAACWSLISRNPNTVAAAVILAGTGATGASDRVAKNCLSTPIWTFHGDVDTTLSVEGTRQIVSAIKALGGTNITYTEMQGYDHTIWVDAPGTKGLTDWMLSKTRAESTGTFSLTLDTSAPSNPPVDPPSSDTSDIGTDTSKPADSSPADSTPVDSKPADSTTAVTDPPAQTTEKPSDTGTGSVADTGTGKAPGTNSPDAHPSADSGSDMTVVIVISVAASAAVIAVCAVLLIKKKK